jgi:predicted dehydrogenase
MSSRRSDRRAFLGGAALAANATRTALGANDRIRLGLLGAGGRGRHVARVFATHPDCLVAAVCDVYQPNLEQAKADTGGAADAYADYRRVLERKDIDAVLIAAPDHWHGPMTVAACEAGKDVYVEKPLSNNIADCLKMIEAARRHQRVVQVGLQQRSWPHFQDAAKLVQDGLIGRVSHAAAFFPGGYTRPPEPPQDPPPDLDWEMFQGPAPRRPYVPSRQKSWRSFYDYGGGLITDWGVHLIDVVHWYLDDPSPRTAAAAALQLRLPQPDPQQAPDTFSLVWNYERFVLTFTNCAIPSPEFNPAGTYFFGERGVLLVNRSGYLARPIRPRGKPGEPQPPLPFEPLLVRSQQSEGGRMDPPTRAHIRNFLDAVKSRQRPNCDVEVGFRSTLPTLLAVLAVRSGQTITWDGREARPA